MNLSLEHIERQLQELRANKPQSALPYPPTSVEQPIVSLESLKELIREVVVQEVALVKDSLVTAPIVNEQTAPLQQEIDPKMSLFQAIGLGLTVEEQNWLSQPNIFQGIQQHLPLFFQTEDGKLAVQSFIIYYKGVHNDPIS